MLMYHEESISPSGKAGGTAAGTAAGGSASSVQFRKAQSRLAAFRPAGMGAALGGHLLGISVLTGSSSTV